MEKKDVKFNKQFNLPDHYNLNEDTDKNHPYKLITAPAHNFLNSSFTELETSRRRKKINLLLKYTLLTLKN